MTQGQLLDRVTDLLGDKSAATRTLLTPWVPIVLNDMLLKDVLSPMAEWTANTVVSQRDYSFPTDMRELSDIYIPSKLIFLRQADDVRFDEIITDAQVVSTTTVLGDPQMFRILRLTDDKQVGSFRLWPTPQAVDQMVLHGQANFDTVAVDTDVIGLKAEVANTAIMGLYRIAARFDNLADIPAAAAAYGEGIRDSRFKQFGRETRPYVGRVLDP